MTNLSQLVDRIENEAGWQLYLHACGTAWAYTDWPELFEDPKERERLLAEMGEYDYVRATHNLRFHPRDSEILSDIKVYSNLGDKVHGLKDKFRWHLSEGSEDRVRFISYGVLIHSEERKSLLHSLAYSLGFDAGPTKTVIYTPPLSEIVISSDESDAHFLNIPLNVKHRSLTDSSGRPASPPNLTIISNQSLMETAVDYLKNNPKKDLSLVRALMPADKFPAANANILPKARPIENPVFYDSRAK